MTYMVTDWGQRLIKIILGVGRTLSGRMLSYDALSMSFREFKLQPNPNTPAITKLIDYQEFCGIPQLQEDINSSEEPFERLSVQEAKSKLDRGWEPIWIDVRKPHELEIVSLDQVDLVKPHEQITEIIGELPKDRDILVMCKKGGRSAKACQALANAGVTRLYNLDGGITDWATHINSSLPTY